MMQQICTRAILSVSPTMFVKSAPAFVQKRFIFRMRPQQISLPKIVSLDHSRSCLCFRLVLKLYRTEDVMSTTPRRAEYMKWTVWSWGIAFESLLKATYSKETYGRRTCTGLQSSDQDWKLLTWPWSFISLLFLVTELRLFLAICWRWIMRSSVTLFIRVFD